MKVRQNVAIALSGITWMGIGILLLSKGFSLILTPPLDSNSAVLPFLSSYVGTAQQASLILICLGLFIGFLKGRLVLSRSASRIIARIVALPNPCSLTSIYPRSYLILLASMMGLGMLFKWIPLPYDVKGLIDVAIGSALTNGSAFYFRHFASQNKGIAK